MEIASRLGNNWTAAFDIDSRTWEEILAGALEKEGFKVILTPLRKDRYRGKKRHRQHAHSWVDESLCSRSRSAS
jgi:hypothetical protein